MTGITFALLYNEFGVCVEAPPVARWCVGKREGYLREYWAGRGAKIALLPP